MSTVLITGCSSRFGLDIARHFLDRGREVVATMRHLDEGVLPPSDRLRLLALDVTDADSIRAAVAVAGTVDVLVNNAGIGWLSPLESTPVAASRELFETNTLGAIAVTQALLPQMRQRRAGVIVNVSSSVTLRSLPLLSVYTASKAALNAFSGCLALEVAPFGVRVKLVLPGRAPDTRFGDNARARMGSGVADGYGELVQKVMAGCSRAAPSPARPTWRKRCGGPRPIPTARCGFRRGPMCSRWRQACHERTNRAWRLPGPEAASPRQSHRRLVGGF